MQTQGTTAKKTRTKESRPKKAKQANSKVFAPLCSDEPVKPNRQKKNKEYQKKKQDWKNSSPTNGNNAIKDKKGDKKCYNC